MEAEVKQMLVADRVLTIQAAAMAIARAALDLFTADQHKFSTRPCETCKAISGLINEPFGCVELVQKEKMSRQILQARGVGDGRAGKH